jgi:hypothetical protein
MLTTRGKAYWTECVRRSFLKGLGRSIFLSRLSTD